MRSPRSFVGLLLWMVGVPVASAQSGATFPFLFGPGNAGKEFFFSLPSNYEDPQATQQYIRLYIASPVETNVRISVGGRVKRTVKTVPGDVVTVDLTKLEAQTVNRGNMDPVPVDSLYEKKGIHVNAEAPIMLYVMNRAAFTSDGMLVLPLNGLGREYIIASAKDVVSGTQEFRLPSQYVVTAPYDSTVVVITHAMDTPNHPAGKEFTVVMHQGDVFSAMSAEPGGDLSGTTIKADKPIAVMSGAVCTFLPDERYRACDHLLEMMFPVSSWGKLYHSMPYATRLKGDLYRIFAGEENAKIYINNQFYTTLSATGGTKGTGWMEYLPLTRGPMEFRSDKPIYVAQYNNSQTYDNLQSDPFYSGLTPVEQYQTEFLFTTPSNNFNVNYINLVCDSMVLRDIEIAPGGTDNFEKLWKKHGEDFKVFPTPVNGKRYIGKTFEIAPGTYRMRGPSPFAAYLYGFSSYDSYGYPLAAAVADLTIEDTTGPNLDRQDAGGDSIRIVIEGANTDGENSPLSTIDLDPRTVSNMALRVDDFQPGISRTVVASLRLIDPRESAQGAMVVCDMAGNCTVDTVWLSATTDASLQSGPENFVLEGITPNPVTKRTVALRYAVERPSVVSVTLHDPAGMLVKDVMQAKVVEGGTHALEIDLAGLAVGTYYCRITISGEQRVYPILIVR